MAVSTTVQVTLPAMGESVTEGTVLEWHKAEGDHVEADETLVEISTDKVDAEVPAPVSGTVVKIHAAEGDTVTVGAVLAEILPADARQRRRRATATAPARRGHRAADADAARPRSSTSSRPARASRSPRARCSSGTSRSATPSRTATRSSRSPPTRSTSSSPLRPPASITELLAAEGETVTVGQVIARMQLERRRRRARRRPPAAPTRPPPPARPATPASAPDGMKVSPVAARVAAAEGVDLAGGHRHRARAAASRRPTCSPPATAAPRRRPRADAPQPLRGGAAMLAKYMDESRSIPTATSFRTLTVTQMDGRAQAAQGAPGRRSPSPT